MLGMARSAYGSPLYTVVTTLTRGAASWEPFIGAIGSDRNRSASAAPANRGNHGRELLRLCGCRQHRAPRGKQRECEPCGFVLLPAQRCDSNHQSRELDQTGAALQNRQASQAMSERDEHGHV